MTWLKIDEKVRSHPKLIQAVSAKGGDVGWFWLCGLAYAREQSTDGFLADGVLSTVAPGLKGWRKAPPVLVAEKLWTRVEGGYQIRDYFDWNPSKAELDTAKQEDRDRKAEERAKRKARASGHETDVPDLSGRTPLERPGPRADAGASSPSSLPLDSGFSGSLEGGPGETVAEVAAARTLPPREGVAQRAAALGVVSPLAWERQHGTHAFRADFCAWVCLPQGLVDDFVRRLAGAGTDRTAALLQVHAWALAVMARWTAGAEPRKVPGEDSFVFWKHEWAATHGSNKPASSPAFAGALDALREAERRG